MANEPREARHSHALEPELIRDPQLKAEAEAANGLRQYDCAVKSVQDALERPPPIRLRLSLILTFHREALQGISAYAGNFRPADVEIRGSKHQPPGAHLVPGLVEELCDYVNEHWQSESALHLAAYVMWRLNWIHPFADGNGRTSRVLSFFVLRQRSVSFSRARQHCPNSLDQADAAWEEKRVDVSAMENLIKALLAKQLTNVYKMAGDKPPKP